MKRAIYRNIHFYIKSYCNLIRITTDYEQVRTLVKTAINKVRHYHYNNEISDQAMRYFYRKIYHALTESEFLLSERSASFGDHKTRSRYTAYRYYNHIKRNH